MEPYTLLRLKPGKETLLSKRHPWLFSGALAQPPEGHLVRVADASGNVLAVGTASAPNPLAVRIFRFDDGPLDEAFFRQRLESALAGRKLLGLDGRVDLAALLRAEVAYGKPDESKDKIEPQDERPVEPD